MLTGEIFFNITFTVAACLLPAAAVAIWARLRLQKFARELAVQHQLLLELKKTQSQTVQGTIGMGQRMLRLEKRIKLLLEQPSQEPLDEQSFSYTQANQMIQQGADVDTIAATCGISHSEAHLMQRLCAEGLTEFD